MTIELCKMEDIFQHLLKGKVYFVRMNSDGSIDTVEINKQTSIGHNTDFMLTYSDHDPKTFKVKDVK